MLDSSGRNRVARWLAGVILLVVLIGSGGVAATAAPPRMAQPPLNDAQAVARAINTIAPIAGGYELQHPTHVARFTERGLAFAPKGGGPSWHWRLAGIQSSGGATLPTIRQAAVAPTWLNDTTIGYLRAGVIEQYVARAGTIEQQFVVPQPLALDGGDLIIAGTVESAGEFAAIDGGWRWRSADGGVRLGDVYVFDAAGREIPASMSASAAGTRIVVDGQAMAGAAYPITIDPQVGPDDVRISTMGPAGDANFQGLAPDVAYNPTSDEYLVVWHGDNDIDGKFSVYGQRVNARTAALVGGLIEIGRMVNPDTSDPNDANFDAVEPAVAYNSVDNEFMVVWQGTHRRPITDAAEIFGQRVSATGALAGGQFRITDVGADPDNDSLDALDPDIAHNSVNNEYLIAYVGDEVNSDEEIYGQRIDASGAEVGADDFRISQMGTVEPPSTNYNNFDGVEPAVAYNATSNEYLVVWAGDDVDNSIGFVSEIFGQRIRGSDGAAVGTNDFSISNMGATAADDRNARSPDVATNTVNNRYLIVWQGEDATANEFDIYGQQMDSAGGAIGTDDFQISAMGPAGDVAYAASVPAVAYNPSLNEYLIVWRGDHDGAPLQNDDFEIFGERLTAGGAVRENDFRISTMGDNGVTTGTAEMPAVAYGSSATNAYLAVWQGTDNPPADEGEIYGQLVAAQGDLEIVSKTVNKPQLVAGEPVSYVITYRNAGPDTILGTQVRDTVPASITGVSFTSSPVVSASGGPPNYVFTTGNLASGASGTITINGTVSAAAPAGTVVANTASISATTLYHDPAPANNSGSVSFTVVEPLLLIDKTLQTSASGVDAADVVRYQIRIDHSGTSSATAHNLNVSDDMPAALQGTTIVSALVTDGINSRNVAGALSINGSGDLVTSGDIDLAINTNGTTDETLTVVIQGTVRNVVNPGGTIANAATVTWQNLLGTQLPSYTATDLAPTITIPAPFSVTKSTNPAVSAAVVGETITYQLATTVIEGTTNSLQWVDTLPAGVSYVPGSVSVSGANGMTVNGLSAGLAGQVLTISASSVVNPGNVDNAAAADSDTFLIAYQVTVNPVPSGTVLTNSVDASANPGLSDNDNSVSVTVIEPALLIDKTLQTPTGGVDAADLVRYQIRIDHSGTSSATAHNLNLSDDMPAALQGTTIVSALVTDGVNSRNVAGALSINGSGDLVTSGDIDLAINTNGTVDETLTIVIQGTVRNAVNPGGTIANAATVIWQNGAGLTLPSYTATDLAPTITIPAPFSVTKSTNPAVSAVGVGETITYQLATTVIEGTTNSLQWVDTLPAGVSYVPGSVSVSGANGMTVNGLSAGLAGQVLTISASSVVNPGNVDNAAAADSDTFLIAYQVTVNPVPSGTVLTNSVDASADPGLSDNDNSVSVTVIEPELTIDTTLLTSSAGVDAADVVRYRIVVAPTATSGANANDLLITDTLPVQLQNLTLVSAVVSDGATSTNVSGAFAINAGVLQTSGDVDLRLNTNGAQDEILTIVIQGTVRDTITPAATIANSATLTWENVAGQRRPGYTATDAAPSITVPTVFSLDKALTPAAATVNVGQELTYNLTTTLLEGTTTNLQWVDTLPAGVSYVPGSATVSNANGMTVNGFSASLAGQVLTIQAGSVVNPGNVNNAAAADSDSVVIAYRVTVNPVPSGTVLTNSADGAADPGLIDNDNTTTVTVAEPELTLGKTLLTSSAGVDAADSVRYQIRISHTAASASNALNLTVADDLPAALQNPAIESAIVSDGATSTNVSGAFSINGAGDLETSGDVDLRLNTNGSNDEILTIILAGTVRDTITPTATIANSATVTWENVAGLQNPAYAASGAAPTITVPGFLAVTKAVVDDISQVAIGQVFTYELTTVLLEGTTSNLQWIDTLPAGLRYVPGSAAVSDANGMTVNGFSASLAGQVLTIQASSVVHPGTVDNPSGPDLDPFTIRYDVVVEASATAGAVLTNSVDASADNVPPDNDNAVSVTVIAPDLTISKTADDDTPGFGQTVTYSINVSHTLTSTANAHDLIITDTLPLGLNYVPGSASLPPSDVDESGNPVIVFRIPLLSLGGNQTFTYQAAVGSPPAVGIGDSLTNNATLAWTTQPGPSPDERAGTATAAETVTVTVVDLAISKAAQPAIALPGAAITYTLAFTNQGNLMPASIVLTDTIPSQITGAAFTSSGATVIDTGFAPAYVWSIAGLAPGQTGYITVTGTLDPAITTNQTITNTATIAANGDMIPGNNSASATIEVIAPIVRFISQNFSVLENAVNATITVEVSVPNPISDVTVNYATSNGTALAGSDYTAATGTLTIPRGQTSAAFPVGLIDDAIVEPTETLTLTLSNPSGAALGAPSTATLSLFNVTRAPQRVYLPLVVSPLMQPDLVVDSVSATATSFTVVVRNRGLAPVTTGFWVDAYINPLTVPTQANQPWHTVAPFGLAWGVNGAALPLDPGETLTLTRGGQYYAAQHSSVPPALPAGSRLYAHADSFGPAAYAAVRESHEFSGGPYNNILGPLSSTVALIFAEDHTDGEFDPTGLPQRTP